MRRIHISDRVRDIAERYATSAFASRNRNFDQPIARLWRLCFFLIYKQYDSKFSDYVDNLRFHYRQILKLEPDDFDTWHQKYFDKVDEDEMSTEIEVEDNEGDKLYHLPLGKHAFSDLVIWAMRYDDLREKEILPYLMELNINSCVYCNAQYTIALDEVTDKDDNVTKKDVALYQLDHYWPKSKHPFLCTTFFNLLPSCANCNLHKGDKKGYFSLYTRSEDEKVLNPMWFEVHPQNVIDGTYGYKAENITIKLCSDKKTLLEKHQEYFMVNDVYKYHRREAEEAIVKMQFYDTFYRKQLQKSLSKLFPEGVESPERFFWGHEMEEEKVFERPLNKLIQDVVKFVK